MEQRSISMCLSTQPLWKRIEGERTKVKEHHDTALTAAVFYRNYTRQWTKREAHSKRVMKHKMVLAVSYCPFMAQMGLKLRSSVLDIPLLYIWPNLSISALTEVLVLHQTTANAPITSSSSSLLTAEIGSPVLWE